MTEPGQGDLPAGWSVRPASLDDVPAILVVLHAVEVAAIGQPESSSEEVVETLTAANAETLAALDPTGRIVGWASLWNPARADHDDIDVYAHPEDGLAAVRPLIRWCLDSAARRAREWGLPELVVRCGVIPNETAMIEALTAAGFSFRKRHAKMQVELPAPVSVRASDGVTIRLLDHEDEADLRTFHRILFTAFEDTGDWTPYTFAEWQDRIGRLPSISWDEWWVAEVDGVPAGILQSANQNLEQNEGWVKNLAVLREYRRRGVARALLSHAFATYYAKGRKTAGLGVDLTNPTGAYGVYRAVGMAPAFEANQYVRTVPAAQLTQNSLPSGSCMTT